MLQLISIEARKKLLITIHFNSVRIFVSVDLQIRPYNCCLLEAQCFIHLDFSRFHHDHSLPKRGKNLDIVLQQYFVCVSKHCSRFMPYRLLYVLFIYTYIVICANWMTYNAWLYPEACHSDKNMWLFNKMLLLIHLPSKIHLE